jgi:threonine aldolase
MTRLLADFRSDTVTKPTPEMRRAMAEAPVGDDVCDGDPTVDELQRTIAEELGKEAALYVPSGTMSNQIALRLHCSPGDEILCEAECHIYCYEQGGYAQLSGLAVNPIPGRHGILSLEDVEDQIRGGDEHLVTTKLLCLENTHNRGGGTIYPLERVRELCDWARKHDLATHLDGARLFNASAASGIPLADWAEPFDTVSVCFSKGLGAPVGSALVGSEKAISKARRVRKLFGGGMRQAGIVAAGALYALNHHRERLVEDHARAQRLADGITRIDGLSPVHSRIPTNIVLICIDQELGSAAKFQKLLEARGVLTYDFGKQILRAVTHLDVDDEAVERFLEACRATVEELQTTSPAR